MKYIFRTLLRDKTYAFLNIIGLSLGMACFILLTLYLRHELSFDNYHNEKERIFRVLHETDYGNTRILGARSSNFLGPLLARDYPQIDTYVSLRPASQTTTMLRSGDNAFYLESVYIADNSLFDIFTHDIIFGNLEDALTRPNTIAINQSTAKLFYGEANPVGEILSTANSDFEVTLVFADVPENSHLKYTAIIANQGDLAPSANALANFRGNLWNLGGFTYVRLTPNSFAADGEEVFTDFFDRVMAESTRPGYRARFYLEPLTSIHLWSNSENDLPRGNIYYLYAFAIVAIFILLVACANYMNMATASVTRRAREITVRKILGANRKALVGHFLAEAIVYSLLALVISVCLVELVLIGSIGARYLGADLSLGMWDSSLIFVALVALGLAVGVVAGFYPAMYLATINTHTQFKSWRKSFGNKVREGLVLTQFTVSIAIISAATLMYLQMQYINSKPLGFEKENKLVIQIRGADAIEQIEALTTSLISHPQIDNASLVRGSPIGAPFNAALEAIREDGTIANVNIYNVLADENFIDSLGLSLTSGRNFSAQASGPQRVTNDFAASPLSQVILNETAVSQIGWEDPLGKTFNLGPNGPYTVIGVVDDFHFQNMHLSIDPFVIFRDVYDYSEASPRAREIATRELIVSLSGDSTDETLAYIEEQWNELSPFYTLQYEFLEDEVEQFYQSDNQQMNLIGILALVCVFISCLGLFGLMVFTTASRTKEIGIRKVLGAWTYQIVLLLFRQVFRLILIASLIATVLAYLIISGWLENFYYRDAINPIAFAFAAGISTLIAFITVSSQAYRTAITNPIEALRYE